MDNVQPLRKTVLPQDLYNVIEKFMFGELISLQITAMTNAKKIKHFSFGFTPEPLAKISDNKPCEVIDLIPRRI